MWFFKSAFLILFYFFFLNFFSVFFFYPSSLSFFNFFSILFHLLSFFSIFFLSSVSLFFYHLSTILTSQVLVVSEIWRFLWFFKNIFKKFESIFVLNVWNSVPCSCMMSEYSQGLRILILDMSAQIFRFRDMTFFVIFRKYSRKLQEFCFSKF